MRYRMPMPKDWQSRFKPARPLGVGFSASSPSNPRVRRPAIPHLLLDTPRSPGIRSQPQPHPTI